MGGRRSPQRKWLEIRPTRTGPRSNVRTLRFKMQRGVGQQGERDLIWAQACGLATATGASKGSRSRESRIAHIKKEEHMGAQSVAAVLENCRDRVAACVRLTKSPAKNKKRSAGVGRGAALVWEVQKGHCRGREGITHGENDMQARAIFRGRGPGAHRLPPRRAAGPAIRKGGTWCSLTENMERTFNVGHARSRGGGETICSITQNPGVSAGA